MIEPTVAGHGPAAPVGIVLAGGRSSRFGRDKLAEPIDGEPLLWRPIRALAAAGCAEVLLVIAPDGVAPPLPDGLGSPIRVVRDPESFGGPLAGLVTGLTALTARTPVDPDATALLVGGDQPSLAPTVLADLDRRVRGGPEAALLADATDRPRPLPMAVRVAPALRASIDLLAVGERRLRIIVSRLDVEVVPLAVWRRLDPSAATLADIDLPADLPDLAHRDASAT